QLLPNSDKALDKASTEFAADAARRFPYKIDAPRAGEAEARAQVGYMSDVIEIENLSNEDWENVEMWVNQQYVIFLPKRENHKLNKMTSQMTNTGAENYLPIHSYHVDKIELYRDGKMYDVKLQLAD